MLNDKQIESLKTAVRLLEQARELLQETKDELRDKKYPEEMEGEYDEDLDTQDELDDCITGIDNVIGDIDPIHERYETGD